MALPPILLQSRYAGPFHVAVGAIAEHPRSKGLPLRYNAAMPLMDPQFLQKSAALDQLYGRITEIAGAMGGTAVRILEPVSFPNAMEDTPRRENAPALHMDMPDDFRVEFAPSFPLSIGNALSVRAVRTHGGGRKNDWTFTHSPDGWRRTQAPLSDDEIRACLKPEGPRAAVY